LVYYYNCNSQDDDIMLLMCNPLFILNDFHYLHDVKPASYIRPELLIIIIWARATSSEETENKTVTFMIASMPSSMRKWRSSLD
jgi:hypothetical protein